MRVHLSACLKMGTDNSIQYTALVTYRLTMRLSARYRPTAPGLTRFPPPSPAWPDTERELGNQQRCSNTSRFFSPPRANTTAVAQMDKHEDAAGLRLVRIGGKGTAWIFTEQAERAQVHSTVWRHGEHAASASTSMSTGTSTGMRVDPAPSPALSSHVPPGGVARHDEASVALPADDPLQRWFAEAVAVVSPGAAALRLGWSAAQGRHAVASRAVARGEVLMVVPAVATVPIDGDSWAAAAVARIGGADAVGLDASVLALARGMPHRPRTPDEHRPQACSAGTRPWYAPRRPPRTPDEQTPGTPAPHACAPCLALPWPALCEAGAAPALASLISHRERLDPAALGVWREAAAALAAALRGSPSASASSSSSAAAAGDGEEAEALLGLLLRVKANAHRVLDDDTASAAVGLGLFPAACLLNHGCVPSALLHYREGGRSLHVRALAPRTPRRAIPTYRATPTPCHATPYSRTMLHPLTTLHPLTVLLRMTRCARSRLSPPAKWSRTHTSRRSSSVPLMRNGRRCCRRRTTSRLRAVHRSRR
jgi:hypothetical protein